MNQGTLKSSIKPREGRHEISQGFAQYSKHRSPFRASIQLAFFPWLYAMGYNLSPHSGLKWVPLGSYPEPMTWNPPESNDSLPRLSCNLVNTKKPFSIEPNAAAFQDLFPATLIAVSINDPSFKNQTTDNNMTICHRWRPTDLTNLVQIWVEKQSYTLISDAGIPVESAISGLCHFSGFKLSKTPKVIVDLRFCN